MQTTAVPSVLDFGRGGINQRKRSMQFSVYRPILSALCDRHSLTSNVLDYNKVKTWYKNLNRTDDTVL